MLFPLEVFNSPVNNGIIVSIIVGNLNQANSAPDLQQYLPTTKRRWHRSLLMGTGEDGEPCSRQRQRLSMHQRVRRSPGSSRSFVGMTWPENIDDRSGRGGYSRTDEQRAGTVDERVDAPPGSRHHAQARRGASARLFRDARAQRLSRPGPRFSSLSPISPPMGDFSRSNSRVGRSNRKIIGNLYKLHIFYYL